MTHARNKLIYALAAKSFVFIAFAAPALAGELSQQQIFDSLTTPTTRGLTVLQGDDHSALVDGLRHRGTRSLTTKERKEIAAMADERPSVDLQIYFEFNSATIATQAAPQLTKLGSALAKPELKGSLVTISGYTDAKGSDSYNQRLSERRAESVKRYLVDNFRLSPENLVTVGYGKQKPKNTADPFSPENRRVQVVNLDSQTQARR
jgi:outer membrane protein OmpA-like peptidoglycan-associated protein